MTYAKSVSVLGLQLELWFGHLVSYLNQNLSFKSPLPPAFQNTEV